MRGKDIILPAIFVAAGLTALTSYESSHNNSSNIITGGKGQLVPNQDYIISPDESKVITVEARGLEIPEDDGSRYHYPTNKIEIVSFPYGAVIVAPYGGNFFTSKSLEAARDNANKESQKLSKAGKKYLLREQVLNNG